jgi:predicted Zn-dependent protease with MMP-like domain
MAMDAERSDESSALDRAWEALDEGDAQAALELAASVDPGLREGWILRASAHLEEGELREARQALEQAGSLPGPEDDLDLLWVRGEERLRSWRIDEARAQFERAAELERSPAVLGRLALCADLEGEPETADRLLREAERLDPENWPFPPRLAQREFEDVLDSAIAELPEPFQRALVDTQILVEPVPSEASVPPEAAEETPPDLLGLFVGPSILESSHEASLELPPTILLFQRNLERAARDADELVEEIRITLYHEIGHMLGFDEEGVEGMGLE